MLSPSSLIGLLSCGLVIFYGIFGATEDWRAFVDWPSVIIVLGGTVASTFIGYRWRFILRAFMAIPKVYVKQKVSPESLVKDVGMIIDWSKRVQKDGKLAYDAIGKETKYPFVKFVTSLVGTGYSTQEVKEFGETNIEEHYFRHLTECSILNSMASVSPAFGMVGTLIGLIIMLTKMESPSEMGPGLSVALLTTFYGVLFARMIFQPTSTKLKQILSIERFREYLILEGITLIMEKKSAFYIQDKLNSYLDRGINYNLTNTSKK